jgi:[protein-PII] uridylyltransferase
MDHEPLAGQSGRQLARRRSNAVDDAIRELSGAIPPRLVVAAVGSYGRRELVPGSDIDLLFLHSDEPDERVQRLVAAVLYPLWDAGLHVSHAVRTPDECRREGTARLESFTSLLDARAVAGWAEIAHAVRTGAEHEISGSGRDFRDALRRSRAKRSRKFGYIGDQLEPDIKESLGGLRDIQLLRWVEAGARDADSERGATSQPAEPDELDHLLLVRTALHRVSSSRSNRLSADHHEAVAELLGIKGRPGWEPRDWLMRELSQRGRSLEVTMLKVFGPSDLDDHRGGQIGTDKREVSPFDLRLPGGSPWNPRGLSAFLELISLSVAAAYLRTQDACGELTRLLPEWEHVRGRPQRDPYHRYPVDAHLLETLSEAGRFVREPDEVFAAEAARTIGDPAPLFLAALLHDIGKDGHGSHVPRGVEVADRALDRMGVEGALRDDVLFLVGEHLLLSDTATRRNLEDEDLILHVAARIGDQRRLALLYLLTVADAHATGPTASSPWRLGLIRELVAKVSHAFVRGLMDRDRAGRLARAESELREALVAASIPPEAAGAFLAEAPARYVLWARAKDAPDHFGLITPTLGPGEVRTSVRPGDAGGTYQLSLGAVDRLGLLAAVAGSMTLAGLSILSAQAFTTERGLALDVFEVRGAFEDDVTQERWDRFRALIGQVLQGSVDLRESVHALRAHYRAAPKNIPVKVRIDVEASDFYTVVEVSAPDRLGLLFDLASTISEHDLDVHVAKVATYGDRVVDVFYVRDAGGPKVVDPERAGLLERSLAAAASAE